MRSRRTCARPGPARYAARASGKAAGCCWTTWTLSSTCSTPRSVRSTLWNGCGRTARRSSCPRRCRSAERAPAGHPPGTLADRRARRDRGPARPPRSWPGVPGRAAGWVRRWSGGGGAMGRGCGALAALGSVGSADACAGMADRHAGEGGMSSESVPGPDSRVRLVLWRHGQTPWNVQGRFQGQTDIELDEVGVEQAERAARLLAALRPDAIIASDLSRALATAAPLARLTGLTVTTDKDLRERHGGAWEGLSDVEIRAQYPAEHASWLPPDGESSAVVAERAGAALERIAESLAPGGLAVVVSHGAAIRLGAERLLGLPEDFWGVVGPLANCAWSVLGRRRSRWRLLEHNAGT